MADMFDRLLVSCPNGGGLFYLDRGTAWKLDNIDTTGLTVRHGVAARAMQPAGLVLLSGQARDVDGQVARIDDLHDAYLDADSCFVVSTHGNEIVELDVSGAQRNRWAFPGEPDAWHINCVVRWNGRMVFSAFADRREHRAYKQPPLDVGFVQDLESGARLVTGLFQPHSLVADGDRLLLANSGAFELREYGAGAQLLRKSKLDGYTRGVARVGNVVYVGLSKTRNVDVPGLDSAVLVALDAETWQEIGRIALSVDEIYAVQPLSTAAAAAVVARLAAHASARFGAELASVKAARDAHARNIEASERALLELRHESERKVFGLLETVQGKDVQIQNRDQIIRDKDAEVGRRDALIAGKDAQLAERDAALKDNDRKIFGLLETVQGKDVQIQNRDQIIRDKDAQLAALATQHARQREQLSVELAVAKQRESTLNDRLAALASDVLAGSQTLRAQAAELGRVNGVVADQARAIADRDHAIVTLQRTLSWRLTEPLRAVHRAAGGVAHAPWLAPFIRPVNKARHVCGTLRRTLGDPERRMRYLTLARVLGPRLAVKHTVAFLRRGGPRPRAPIPVPVFDIRGGRHRRAVILTTQHCDFVAASIQHALARIGVLVDIIHERPAEGYADLPHFVICPQMFQSLPGLYVAFQMEQSVSTRWFTPEYIRQLENSFAILDYSTTNIDALVEKGLQRKQFFYLPLGYLPDYGWKTVSSAEDYDVVFYGDINNDRRKRFVAALERVCRVKVLCNVFGEELHAELAKAKLVVNIHYYEGALLETTRLWECVSLGKLVISERAVNMEENRDLERLVDFVNVNEIDGMVERVRYWLANDAGRRAKVAANRKLALSQPNRFEYFFYRFLLAWDIISFYRFWELAGSKLTLTSDKLCLNLPEWTLRRRSFDRDNRYGFEVFPGLRHRLGWVGCGMSYKLMIMIARKQHVPQITICEDDVEFRAGFTDNLREIMKVANRPRSNWDVISGFLGDLHEEAIVTDVKKVGGHQLASIDKLISMVFNVYKRTVYDRVCLWDETDRDVSRNTVDRYLENKELNTWACYPFLVGQKGELQSTLWGVKNIQMDQMIRKSEMLLGAKIRDHA